MKTKLAQALKAARMGLVVTAIMAAFLAGGYLSQRALAQQPHMKAALEALQTAKEQLEKATADKGGHRKKALEHVRKAINEVEKGIAYDRRH